MNNGRLISTMQARYDVLLKERDELRNEVNGWSAWASTSRCIYCDAVFTHDPINQEEADELKKAHVLVCPKHPLRRAVSVLAELAALVRGECPSLLNEDSGGDANLDMAIDAVLQPNQVLARDHYD